ncbi:MAG: diaminobutyrate acetyltransferase [Sulfurospirillaceae bacterium]|nr:diaminobutyrate acetyltransferase [Sulfurospirillaceae bacterium]
MELEIILRKPQKSDAKQIYNLVKKTKILDVNSEYLYLLQATHFRDTCCVAQVDHEIVGFVSGYICPQNSDVLFVWQVGVDDKYRGKNMAGKMISHILDSESLKGIKYIHTTISPSNQASQRVFHKLANELHTVIAKETMFEVRDFNNAHEDEVLYKIGPL